MGGGGAGRGGAPDRIGSQQQLRCALRTGGGGDYVGQNFWNSNSVRNLFVVFKDLCRYTSHHLRRLKGTNVYNFTGRPNRSHVCNAGDQPIHQNTRAHTRFEAKQRMLWHSLNIANGKPSPLGNTSKRPLFLMSNSWEPDIIFRSFLRSGTDFVAPEFVDPCSPPPYGIPPPPPVVA